MEKVKRNRKAVLRCAAQIISVLCAVFLLAGCTEKGRKDGPATDDPAEGGATTRPTGETQEDEKMMRVAQWETRTLEELTGVGAVTQITAQTKVYNAKALGVPDGGREDAAEAILTAIKTVADAGGGILYFPSGRYRIDAPIKIEGTGDKWVCLAGDPNGSSVIALSTKSDGGQDVVITVARDNTHFSFLNFDDSNRNAASMSVESSRCSLYGCVFNKKMGRCERPCVEVSGSYNTLRQCGFEHQKTDTYVVEFTKYPGRDARGNVLCDTHFGGSYTKSTLVSSHDENGAQEALSIVRNLYLIPAEPMIEVKAVNGLIIANNMLDAASTAIGISPEGYGVFNVEARDNYMGGSKGGVRLTKSDAPGAGISVHDNYIWAPDSFTAYGDSYSNLTVEYNYCVLTGGSAVFMNLCRSSRISGNVVLNIGSPLTELDITKADKASVIDPSGFSSKNIPSDSERKEMEAVMYNPVAPTEHFVFDTAPENTGDTPVADIGLPSTYVNVMDCGAVGDGVTDDTAAVKKCLRDAKSKSGTAYFPAGTYLISETIKVTKDDSKILTVKGDGADRTLIIGAESLNGHIFDIGMKYNFNMKDVSMEHRGQGSCADALYVKAFDCNFTSAAGNSAPLLHFHGSNCWAVRCRFDTMNAESYGLCYTRLSGEISINDFIIDNVFTGPGKGVLVGNGSTVGDGRCEGLKIIGNRFSNTGATQTEVYEILHVNIAYNEFNGAINAVFVSNLGYGPDGVYIDHNKIDARGDCITSGTVDGGGDYMSKVVIHDNVLTSAGGKTISEPVAFNGEMIH
ncbi:MAG: hypothetical protein J5950_08290 [Clostridia bacterium]|nr:hypothetical protein [Clostridia bacterium]